MPARTLNNDRVIVAVATSPSTTWGRGVMRGVIQYAYQKANWEIVADPFGGPLEQFLKGSRPDGLIISLGNPRDVAFVKSLKIPIINVSAINLKNADFPRVVSNPESIASLAGKYYRDLGFKSFGYFDLNAGSYADIQYEYYRKYLALHELNCSLYVAKPDPRVDSGKAFDRGYLKKWISSLEKPVALFTWHFRGARVLVREAAAAGFLVPEEVSVLSGTYDEVFCEMDRIPISSIELPTKALGLRAAERLDKMITAKKRDIHPHLVTIEPIGVLVRSSTNTLAVNDYVLVKALHFIQQNAHLPIDVQSVVRHSGVSRRVLERKFLHVLNRSPGDEIRRTHLERAKRLLVESELQIPEIAEKSGFGSPEYFSYFFKKELKVTPLRYRLEFR